MVELEWQCKLTATRLLVESTYQGVAERASLHVVQHDAIGIDIVVLGGKTTVTESAGAEGEAGLGSVDILG